MLPLLFPQEILYITQQDFIYDHIAHIHARIGKPSIIVVIFAIRKDLTFP